METRQIISWLRDKADRADNPSWTRMMHRAANRLQVLDQKQKWIPVTERLPEQGQEVIVYDGGVVGPKVFAYHFWNKDYSSWLRITHWMPMPEPPKEV